MLGGYDTRIVISMGNKLDDFVNGLQNWILEETRAEFKENRKAR